MKYLKIILSIMILVFGGGCSSTLSNKNDLKVYHYDELVVKVPSDLEVLDETYGLIINGEDWKMTLGVAIMDTATQTMNAWEGYLYVAKSIHPNMTNTNFLNQDAIQYVDSSIGLRIETYLNNPENTQLIFITLYDNSGNHEKLLENKTIRTIIENCEIE